MPAETGRKRARKRVTLPTGDEVEIPVIVELSFVDPFERAQETRFAVLNDSTGDRKVHVDDVPATDTNGAVIDQRTLKVERIDEFVVLDPFERAQETRWLPDNVTGNDLHPPSFTTHLEKHVYRYYQDPENPDDDDPWIDVEMIDSWAYVDPFNQSQETVFTLDNPPRDDMSGQVSQDDPDITDTDNGIDPPFRTDPWQNIVNWRASGGQTIPIITVFFGCTLASEVSLFQEFIPLDTSAPWPPPPDLLQSFYTFLKGGIAGHTSNTAGSGSLTGPVVSGLPGTVTPDEDPEVGGQRFSWQPANMTITSPEGDLWTVADVHIGGTISGLSVTVSLTYGQVSGSEIQKFFQPVPPHDFAIGVTGGSPQTQTLTVDCSGFHSSFDGAFYGYSGTLHFSTYAVKAFQDQNFTAYLCSAELGPPPGIP